MVDVRSLKIRAANLVVSIIWPIIRRKDQSHNRIPVLCYHRVLPDFRERNERAYAVAPDQFEAQMAWLSKQGFVSLSLEEYGDVFRGVRSLPYRSVVVTFDDGYADNYTIAWPIARKYRVKLNLFVCTGLISRPEPIVFGSCSRQVRTHIEKYPNLWRPLSWDQLREMAPEGVEIGFHGHSHKMVSSLSSEELRSEIQAGQLLFETNLGYTPRAFAFPKGGVGSYHLDANAILLQNGFDMLFTTRLGRTVLPAHENLISRILVYQEDSLASFARKVFGAYDWVAQIRRWDQACSARWKT